MIAQVHPFTFDRIFAAPAPAVEAGLEREHLLAEIEHLRAEVRRAAERGRAQGEADALGRYQAERNTALLAATDALQASIEELDGRFAELEKAVVRDGAALALAAAEQLAGRALAQQPQATIDAAIGRVLAELRRGTPLEVRVHPCLVEQVEAQLAERQARDRRTLHVVVVGDATLPPGDARLLWERGGAHLDQAARREALLRELERFTA